MNIRQATLEDVKILTPLFDAYIVFYKKPSDPHTCQTFLTDRISRNEAIVFLAFDQESKPAGFTLLYPSFSSVSKARIFILNDLFVHPDFRRKGVGSLLLKAAADYGKSKGALRLHLETGHSNQSAQALYEKEGWEKEIDEYHYNYTL